MSDPALAVQKSYVARLVAQIPAVAGRVHDRAPQDVAFPWVQIGDIQLVEDGAGCLDAFEVTITLHVWSRDIGSVEARQIAGSVRAALHEWLPDLLGDGFRCVEAMHRDTRTLPDPDGITSHSVLTFRLLIDRM
jgi:hypothetical protein